MAKYILLLLHYHSTHHCNWKTSIGQANHTSVCLVALEKVAEKLKSRKMKDEEWFCRQTDGCTDKLILSSLWPLWSNPKSLLKLTRLKVLKVAKGWAKVDWDESQLRWKLIEMKVDWDESWLRWKLIEMKVDWDKSWLRWKLIFDD